MRLLPAGALFAVLAAGLVGADGSAQEKKVPADPKDPQAGYEPRSAPGVGQKFLERFVGDWDVVKTFHPRQGEPTASKGECRQEMTHGGRFLRSEFTFDGPGGKTTGTGVIGFEAGSGLFTSVWTDSRATRISVRRSKEKFDGTQIVLHSRPLEDGPDARPSRTVTRLEDDGGKIVHRQFSPAGEGKERLVMELVLTRKPAKPKPGER